MATTAFNSQVMTFVGTAATAYRRNLMYHRDAFAFVTADLPLMADSISCKRMTQDGISLRVWQGSDIRNDEMLMRIDILWGFK
ncbi:P22 phage major capsid protein family protein, partial [Bacillus subtilis]|uniref:P22 phage major capsid protein family protein n=1 Tax=Bacillus subtilis TaxID=1423 RepID=UPI003C229961